ncbi:aspartyl-phosphate phosphatase Spo0E family protein [Clostridium frigidicarnis]|uniref:Spo0E like sporulation regulatory protein n=1 Tax=Clostridium frigidicarnis TaxID=84698 RepID=A0A1I0WVQ3_9CLOT|nr:aspartyl-phosphate phosphatase Spo0E family protein [Clostridium frigidicarnis]SFA92238.1 Spo0E like sporulation regulatory protein [Clostridium frigidicarnis]
MFNSSCVESRLIESRIEDLRNKLNSLTCNNRLTDDIVIQYSEELDELIVKYLTCTKKYTN